MQCFLSRFTGPQKAEWLLRWALAVFFFFAGLGKIMGGVSLFVYKMTPGFEDTMLPIALVAGFFWIVPFLEVLLGLLLFIGWKREISLWLTGVLLILFMFGHKIMGDMASIMPIFVYLLVVAGALYLPAAWKLGCCSGGKFSKK
jgi:thiosulfate dehydrogenase [quinone] large subunit